MANLANYNKYYRVSNSDITANDVKPGKIAYGESGKITGTGFFPPLMKYDGSSYMDVTESTSGNKCTLIIRFKRASFTGDTYERLYHARGGSGYVRLFVRVFSSDFSTAASADRIVVQIHNSSNTLVARLATPVGYLDNQFHMMRISVDFDTPQESIVIDNVDANDTGYGLYDAVDIDTLDTGSGDQQIGGTSGGGNEYNGEIGFIAYDDQYYTDDSAIMTDDGYPLDVDLSGWKLFNAAGDARDNKGTWGDFSQTGDIVVAT